VKIYLTLDQHLDQPRIIAASAWNERTEGCQSRIPCMAWVISALLEDVFRAWRVVRSSTTRSPWRCAIQ